MSRYNIQLGKWGEQLAESQLLKAGAKILERNYHFDPGEIDLLIEHDGDLVAVEVKTRTDLDLETPEEAVSIRKLRRMSLGLQTYAAANDMLEWHWRLDVVAVVIDLDGNVERCEHIRDAYVG